jgi:hypothetical protein
MPVTKGMNNAGTWCLKKADETKEFKSLKAENKELKDTIASLQNKNALSVEELNELETLRELFELDKKYSDYETVGARIISKDTSNWYSTFTIDKGNDAEQMGVKNAGKALRREVDEQVIPAVDMYRLAKMVAGAGTTNVKVISKDNAYEAFLDANATLTENKVPLTGRVAFVNPTTYKFLKLDDSFIKASDIAQSMLITGQVGMVDGIAIILVPASYLPEGVNFVITHKVATVAPKKLEEYRTHIDPPGISGILAEGRIIHDAFVLEQKKMAVYVSKNA